MNATNPEWGPHPWWSGPTGTTPEQGMRDATTAVTNAILNHPRSLQKRIGPSEIGNPCDHCLAARLAGWDKHEPGIPWTTTRGTAMHEWMERLFNQADTNRPDYAQRGHLRRWVTEETVAVGTIGDTLITGSTDLLDLEACLQVDFKFVGASSLRRYRAQGPSQTYRVQAHLYAKGWNDAGVRVDTVSIWFLPAVSAKFSDHFWWHEPYQPHVADDALARANHLHTQLALLGSISPAARDEWISSLPRAQGCWDCARYPRDHTPSPPVERGIALDIPTRPSRPQPNTLEGHHS